MVNLIIAGHGNLAKEMVNSAQMVLGQEYENVYPLCLQAETGIKRFEEEARSVEKVFNGRKLIILGDIHGGSPLNTCLSVFRNFDYRAITGINLAMLIEILSHRDIGDIDQLVELAVKNSISGIGVISIKS